MPDIYLIKLHRVYYIRDKLFKITHIARQYSLLGWYYGAPKLVGNSFRLNKWYKFSTRKVLRIFWLPFWLRHVKFLNLSFSNLTQRNCKFIVKYVLFILLQFSVIFPLDSWNFIAVLLLIKLRETTSVISRHKLYKYNISFILGMTHYCGLS